MVAKFLRSFYGDEAGISLTEGLIVFPILVLSISAIFEFGYAMHQFNASAKALQLAVRLAAVSDPVAPGFSISAIPSDKSLIPGPIAPGDFATVSCSGSTCNDGLNRIVYGSSSATSCVPGSKGICNINPRIGIENITVTYEQSGLGYWGRPYGRVVTIRMEARNVQMELPLLGALIGFGSLTLPALPVSMTSEDLSCGGC